MSLTVRQKKFIQEYMATGNATQSAVKAGYSRASARSTACEILRNPNISQVINQEMYKHGITLELLINVLKEGLNAKKICPMCQKRTAHDWNVRYKFFRRIIKAMGLVHS